MLFPQIIFAQEPFISLEIQPLVRQIEQCETSPVDYVMGLFEKYDVVVLGERDHNEMTQYQLINDIITDRRFIEKVGHIFTEVGCYNTADEINAVLKGAYANDSVFEIELAKTVFNMDYMPVWEKTNYSVLMNSVYQVNKTLPADKKVSVTPTEMPFSWKQTRNMSAEEFQTSVHKMWKYKDIIMGNNAINELYKIFNGSDSRKKALIIYNTPHSCQYFENEDNKQFFAYQIIKERFPDRVVNVALNWAVIGTEAYTSLSNGGKTDAAFAACGNKSVGFDLAETDLGNYVFDLAEVAPKTEVKFKDVYHGFIFYKPVLEWVESVGVPNLDKIDCKDELARRSNLFNNENDLSQEYRDEKFTYYSTIRTFPVTIFFDETLIKNQISRYYRKN